MKVVIVGAGAVGTHLSKLLSGEHQDCVLIDADSERLSGLSEYDVMTYQASPTSIKALKEVGVQHADLFVGVTPEESVNMNACILAHALGAKKTVARIDNYEYLSPDLHQFFKNLGIDSLCRRHHQRSETLLGETALGCARRCPDAVRYQTQGRGGDPEPSAA